MAVLLLSHAKTLLTILAFVSCYISCVLCSDIDSIPEVEREIIASDRSAASKYYNADGEDDLVDSMPNLLEATCSSSPSNCEFRQYSGYLLANNNREIHYWFVESEFEPEKQPIFIWTNGGPGCSGMDGLLTEHGPWKAQKDNKVAYNAYSWNTQVNMIYLEQPYGVGFSALEQNEYPIGGDQNAADDMDAAIRDFIVKFPAFAHHTFYLSSESWGGHYVPMTTYTMLQNNDNGAEPYIKLGGFMLGNPSTDPFENKYGFVGGIHGHGMLKSSDWIYWRENCWDNPSNIEVDYMCVSIHTQAYYNAQNADFYALDYDQCAADERWVDQHRQNHIKKDAHLHRAALSSMKQVLDAEDYTKFNMGHIAREELQTLYDQVYGDFHAQNAITADTMVHAHVDIVGDDGAVYDNDAYDPCIDHYMSDYLNLDEVQEALNVKPTHWDMCSDPVYAAWPSADFESFIEPFYSKIIDQYVDKLSLTLLVYSGDDDSVCGLQGTMFWMDRWEYAPHDSFIWKQWKDDNNELGGFYTRYVQDNDNTALHFMTVRSAGHMVPTTQPSRALTLLKKFLYHFVPMSN